MPISLNRGLLESPQVTPHSDPFEQVGSQPLPQAPVKVPPSTSPLAT